MGNFVYFKRNVKYVVGGRFHATDSIGFTLTNDNPYVAVKVENLRDFKLANKRTIQAGLIVEAPEPTIDWDVPNAITDENAVEFVKKPLVALRNELAAITSAPTLYKLMETAKALERNQKTLNAIQARIDEVEPEEEENFALRPVAKVV
jgi:hypothetical protein